jgi:hypothetical protein
MMSATTIDQIADLRAALARARVKIACGLAVDLRGLDSEIARLMDAAQTAPDDEHLALREGIEALLDEVDILGHELQRHHDAETALHARGAYAAKVATR